MSIELKQAAQQAVDAFDAFGDADDFASLFELTRKMRALRTAIQQAGAQRPATGEPAAWSEREQLRHAQAAVVMPMIGPLLDAWENSDREVMSQEPELSKQLKNINSAMEDADTHPAPSVPADVVLDCYDAGILNDFGGGNVEWWQDYIRAELGHAHDFYQSQIDAAKEAT